MSCTPRISTRPRPAPCRDGCTWTRTTVAQCRRKGPVEPTSTAKPAVWPSTVSSASTSRPDSTPASVSSSTGATSSSVTGGTKTTAPPAFETSGQQASSSLRRTSSTVGTARTSASTHTILPGQVPGEEPDRAVRLEPGQLLVLARIGVQRLLRGPEGVEQREAGLARDVLVVPLEHEL